MRTISIGPFRIGPNEPLAIISGPCVIESEEHALFCAAELQKIFQDFPFSFIFKASYDKANRSSIRSFRGPGMEKGLAILQKVKQEFGFPILTDVHTEAEVKIAGSLCDVIQIPAFLCRQTDLLTHAAKTKATINLKKGQFLAPWDMKNVIEKITASGSQEILLTERGVSFGYNNLVSDMRSIPIMQNLGYPVCFDASHSVQLPGGLGHATGGERQFIPTLAKAAVAAGCNALYIETHPNPPLSKSDADSIFPMNALRSLLSQIAKIYDVVCSKEPSLVSHV